MTKYCPQCREQSNFTEMYRTRSSITYRCDKCGYILVVRIWKHQE